MLIKRWSQGAPVRLSATREVSRLSMPPSRASTRAEATMVGSSSTGKLGIRGTGNPAGICPKVNTSAHAPTLSP